MIFRSLLLAPYKEIIKCAKNLAKNNEYPWPLLSQLAFSEKPTHFFSVAFAK